MMRPNPEGNGETSHVEPEVEDPSEQIFTTPIHQNPPQYSGSVKTFTLDDIPQSQWRQRFQEFCSWGLVQLQKPGASDRDILFQFTIRLIGILKS